MQKHQREFFLREQLKVIQRELGIAKDDKTADVERFEERMAKLNPPEAVQERFKDEIQKLQVLEQGSPEYGVTRNYLTGLPRYPGACIHRIFLIGRGPQDSGPGPRRPGRCTTASSNFWPKALQG